MSKPWLVDIYLHKVNFCNLFVSLYAMWSGCLEGEVAEWLKAHAWKACILFPGIEGSNPSLSA